MLTKSDVLLDPVLSNVSVRYNPEGFVADKIMPMVPVKTETGYYYVYDKENFRLSDTERAAGSPAKEVEYGLSRAAYSTSGHGLVEYIANEVIEQADAVLNPEQDAVLSMTEKLLIKREYNFFTNIMTSTSVLTTYTTLSGTTQWSDHTNSVPLTNLYTGMETVQKAIGRKPNTLLLGQEVFNDLINHPDIVEKAKYTSSASISEDMLARIIGVDSVMVSSAVRNTVDEGVTDSLGYISGKHAWLLYINPRMSLRSVGFGFQPYYQMKQVMKWDDQVRQARAVQVLENYGQELVSANCAYFIQNAVA